MVESERTQAHLNDFPSLNDLEHIAGLNISPMAKIAHVVDLSNRFDEKFWSEWLAIAPNLEGLKQRFSNIYNQYILAMEDEEQANIARIEATAERARFIDCAGSGALAAYGRVDGLVDQLALKSGASVVMVGCGQLPVTALHLLDKSPAGQVVCLDICPKAIASVERLKLRFGYSQLHTQLSDGADFDYADADVVYIANMVRPKLAVINAIVNSAFHYPSVVVREPYSLGHLWAESLESTLPNLLSIKSIGKGSRYLSRDVYLTWQQPVKS